jgi:nitrate/nitrite transporter NarK
MGTVIGARTPLYGFGAIMVHWVSGMLRDATGAYDHSFIICSGMAGVAILFMSMVKRGD